MELGRRIWLGMVMALGLLALFVGAGLFVPAVTNLSSRASTGPDGWSAQLPQPQRGAILDATGHAMATSVVYESLYANASRVTDADLLAKQLAGFTGLSSAELLDKLKTRQKAPVLLKPFLALGQ